MAPGREKDASKAGTKAAAKSALNKAVVTQRHKQPSRNEAGTLFMDARHAAASAGFNMEDLLLKGNGKIAKRAPTNDSGMKTVLAGESAINVERRIRSATVPVGVDSGDVADVVENLTFDSFDTSKLARRLMPKRPVWSYDTSSGRLHHREVTAFKQWLDDVREIIMQRGGYPPAFEQNLQVWRQLWRVLERCDVAVIIVDVRHPLMHLPPALVYHVSKTLKKPAVIVLNKLDAVKPAVAVQWAECLKKGIPGISGVVGFCKEPLRSVDFDGLPVGKEALIEACQQAYAAANGSTVATKPPAVDMVSRDETPANGIVEGCLALEGRIMLGLVGHPNVGKSSMVNSLMGDKVVSVKATPGHTKTLQTMILDDRTCLCDSPGVVFPRLEVPRETQIVGMLIPVAQVREPFSAIRWVMECADPPLTTVLGLKPVMVKRVIELQEAGTDTLRLDLIDIDDDKEPVPWSAMLVCAQYGAQRGFMNNGRPDVHKAGIEILQRVLDGRVAYSVLPPAEFKPAKSSVEIGEPKIEEDDEDDTWEIAEDYESAEEDAPPATSLFEHFGIDEMGPGGGSIASRKKHTRRKKLAEIAGEGYIG